MAEYIYKAKGIVHAKMLNPWPVDAEGNFPKIAAELDLMGADGWELVAVIPANIAEGCGKKSQKELARYLSIVSGSIKEVENFLILSSELGYLEKQAFEELSEQVEKIAKMNHKLMQRVNKIR